MICIRRKKCEKIISHLIQEYHSRHRPEANRLIAEILQDHISRGLANSTIVVTKMLAVKYDYISKLIDCLFQSMEKDFTKYPLKSCGESLIRAAEVEYKKLRPTVNTWLMSAGIAQQGIIKQYESSILKRLEETKNSIGNRCELSTEKHVQRKWWKDPKFVITTILTIIGIVIGVWQYSGPKTAIKSQTVGDSSPSIITTGPNSPVSLSYKDADVNTIETLLEKNNKKLESLIDEFGLMKHEQLVQKYNLGYVLFAINTKNEIIRSKRNRFQENWKIDWSDAKLEISDRSISFALPKIYGRFEDKERIFENNTLNIPRWPPNEYCPFTIPGIKSSGISSPVMICVGLLDETPEGIICFIGLKTEL